MVTTSRNPLSDTVLFGLVALLSLGLGAGMTSATVWAQVSEEGTRVSIPGTVNLPVGAIPPPAYKTTSPKLSTRLAQIAEAYSIHGASWQEQVNLGGLPFDGASDVLLEILFNPAAKTGVQALLESQGGRVRHHNAPGLFEASLPVSTLGALAALDAVYFVRPAPEVILEVGASNTQGISSGGVLQQHSAGITGTGVTIALIDSYDATGAALQASGDWPPPAQLTTVDVDGGGFGSTGSAHGMATLEIAYDMAPGADFIVYEQATKGDWYAAIGQAVTDGADIISMSLGLNSDGVGDGTALPGSIDEAVANARASGALVVKSAGNRREQHWGGLYIPNGVSPGGGYVDSHDWDGPGPGGNLNLNAFCLPNGFVARADLYWDDWTTVDHDYDLFLALFNGASFVIIASSANLQSGLPGQTPQESVAALIAGGAGGFGCPVGTNVIGVGVFRWAAATNRNLQVLTNFDLGVPVDASSLSFPGYSPNVITVGALDVTTFAQESYSSEGPVLAAGGGLPASPTNGQKPDVASFANVDTESYGPGVFNGTSSAAPHVAAMAALMLDHDPTLTVSQLEAEIRSAAAHPANDLGTAGFDNEYGHGVFTFQTLLPVELTAFDALVTGDDEVLLHWETASETNNAGFDVQYRALAVKLRQGASQEGAVDWQGAGYVEGHGTTLEPQAYRYRVTGLAPGKYVFRLKQVDYDGTFEYSPEVEVLVDVPGAYALSRAYPNPFNPETQFTLMVPRTQHALVDVYDVTGRRVAQLHNGLLDGDERYRFVFDAANLPSGLYFVRIIGETFTTSTTALLVK